MTPIINDTLTVAGAAALVASITQLTKFLIDLATSNPVVNARVTRVYVFLVALAIVALPPLQHDGFHLRGDLLSLLTLAGVVASAALGEYHLLTQAPIATPRLPQLSTSLYPAEVAAPAPEVVPVA